MPFYECSQFSDPSVSLPCSPYNAKNPFMAALTTNRELHNGGDRSCMHIELDISGSKLSYIAGDHMAIFPTNDSRMVERIGELLGADLDTVFSLTNVDGEKICQVLVYIY